MAYDLDRVEAHLGRSLSPSEIARAEVLYTAAREAVEAAAGADWTGGARTVTRLVRRGQATLPTPGAVTAVRAVNPDTGAETALTAYTTRGRVIYGLSGVCEVAIDVTVADDPVPAKAESVIAGVLAACLSTPVDGVTQESAGPFSRTFADGSGRVWLSASDRARCRRIYRPKPAIQL